MKKILPIIFFSCLGHSFFAQQTVFEDKRTIYKRENAFGLLFHTRGWGATYRYGVYTSGYTRKTFDAEIVGMKHPKQEKILNSFDPSSAFNYGMLNSIIVFRSGIGRHNTFVKKRSVRGISISSILNLGISLAYAKPVYLEVFKKNQLDGSLDSEIVRYDPDVHSLNDIYGKASWFRGLFSGRFYPGIYLKSGLSFESSRQASRINALEVGAVADVYFQKIPIMANDFNKPYFFNLYVSITFGVKKIE